jgi:hypothetical protein
MFQLATLFEENNAVLGSRMMVQSDPREAAAPCDDVGGFVDVAGFGCQNWVGRDCTDLGAVAELEYTQAGLDEVALSCRHTCALCSYWASSNAIETISNENGNLVTNLVEASLPTQGFGDTPPPGLTAYWPLDGDGRDVIGSNHGLVEGTVAYGDGRLKQALSLTGEGFLNVGSGTDFDTQQYTWSAWVKLRAKTAAADTDDHEWRAALGSRNDWVRIGFEDHNTIGAYGGIHTYATVHDFAREKWYHIVSTRSQASPTPGGVADHARLYINGVLASSGIGSVANGPGTDILCLGSNGQDGHGDGWTGEIDDVGFWRRALSTTEVERVYKLGLAGKSLHQPAWLAVDLQQMYSIGSIHIFAGLNGTGTDYGMCSHTVSIWQGADQASTKDSDCGAPFRIRLMALCKMACE